MKSIIFCFILCGLMGSALAANVAQEQTTTTEQEEQPITVCSSITEFEEAMRNCIEVKKGENCGIGLGFDTPVPEDVGNIVKAFFTNMLASCGQDDLQCMLEQAVSAKGEHCS